MRSNLSRRDFLKLSGLTLLTSSGLRTLLSERSLSKSETTPGNSPNIFIVVLDALSARNMSLYGYQRETTPNMARFAERATVFHRNYSASNFTTSSTASMLTGLYPWSHHALQARGAIVNHHIGKSVFANAPTNYHTFAYTQNLLAQVLLKQFQESIDLLHRAESIDLEAGSYSERYFHKEFIAAYRSELNLLGYYRRLPSLLLFSSYNKLKAGQIAKRIEGQYSGSFPRGVPQTGDFTYFILEQSIDWIQEQLATSPNPYLGYVHLWPPHDPYTARDDFVGLFADGWVPPTKSEHHFSQRLSPEHLQAYRQQYDEYIAYADAEFGRLVDFMEANGILDNSYVILTSDHGEMFERGIIGHETNALNDPVIHTPLIISSPGQQRRVDIHTTTSGIDLTPTILTIMGQPVPDWVEGQVLPGFGGSDAEREIFSLVAKGSYAQGPITEGTITLIRDRYKLIHYIGYPDYDDSSELYDLENDPEELEDLFSIERKLAANLKASLLDKLALANQGYRKH
jgi:arylsulfatase A-like enzyme